jgi:hypothetical protein
MLEVGVDHDSRVIARRGRWLAWRLARRPRMNALECLNLFRAWQGSNFAVVRGWSRKWRVDAGATGVAHGREGRRLPTDENVGHHDGQAQKPRQ